MYCNILFVLAFFAAPIVIHGKSPHIIFMVADDLGYFYDAKIQQAIERFTACSVDGNIKTILANSPGLKEKLATGIDVIEFGAGSCHLLSVIATQFPNSRFTASEFDLELLQKTRTRWASISNMCIQSQDICSDSEDFPNKQYDWVLSVDLIHDLSKPQIALNNFRKAVKEDGICTFIEPATSMYGTHAETVGNPVAATYYTLSTFMCIPESYHEADSATLGAACGKKVMIDMATKAGFLVEEFNMPPSTSLYVCTPVTK